MKAYLIVQWAADRITHIGPAFTDRDEAEAVAASYPDEWHAVAQEVDLDPRTTEYLAAVGKVRRD